MATYVAVSNESHDLAIKAGPFELDDPAQHPVQMGTHLMLESEALSAGYHYASDGAFAPDQPTGEGKKGKKGKKGKGKHTK